MTADQIQQLKQEVVSLQKQVDGANAGPPVYVGQYLLTRLEQLGVSKIFGVPGDFNLGFLDLVEDHKTIEWIGNCNELNASYAADGYARVNSKSIGVLITTFGVGELSATNGIAGAFSEHIPILHIVGVPSTAQMKNKPMLHHTLGDGRFDAYEKAAEQFTITQTQIMNKDTAAAEIDRVLIACVRAARPVYLALPTDMAYAEIPSGRLATPLDTAPPENDPQTQEYVLSEIERLVKANHEKTIILVDACAVRHHVVDEARELVDKTGFPVFSAPMGKSTVHEDHERYGGIYVGTLTHEEIKDKVENAELIISIGSLKSDFNTGNFSYSIPTARTIELHSDHTRVGFAYFQNIGMKRLLPEMTKRLASLHPTASQITVPKFEAKLPQEESSIISQEWLWPRVSQFFREKDIIVAETGTSSFGILDVPLPKNAIFVSQILWGSIGWTGGSTLGAALAARDTGLGRTILFIGDGSLQLTVQEISTMIRVGVHPIIFVLNNSGYTIERHLHGWERKYNDISNWRWTQLLNVLQSSETPVGKSYTVRTKDELSALLDNESFAAASEIQLVELIMDKFDAPPALRRQAELSGKTNHYVPISLEAADRAGRKN